MNLREKRKLIMSVGGGSPLPDGYTPVKCLLFYSGQWIDTGITLTSEDSISIDVELKDYPTATPQYIMGGRDAASSNNISISKQSIGICCDFNNSDLNTYRYNASAYSYNTRYKIFCNKTSRGIEGIGSNSTVCNDVFTCSSSCYIGYWGAGAASAAVGFVGAIYGATIKGKWNGIPCYRNSDYEFGMWDTVSQTFFTNAGIGSFSAILLNPPTGYKQIEYIEGDGNQWFDTGITSTGNLRLDLNALPTPVDTAASQLWFGAYNSNVQYANYYVGPGRSADMNIVYQYYSRIIEVSYDLNSYQYLKSIQTYTDSSSYYYTYLYVFPFSNYTPYTFNINANLSCYMFARHTNSGTGMNPGKFKMFNSRIIDYNSDNPLKRIYLPFRRESDNVAGVYDLLNNTFTTSMTGTDFIAGGFV